MQRQRQQDEGTVNAAAIVLAAAARTTTGTGHLHLHRHLDDDDDDHASCAATVRYYACSALLLSAVLLVRSIRVPSSYQLSSTNLNKNACTSRDSVISVVYFFLMGN